MRLPRVQSVFGQSLLGETRGRGHSRVVPKSVRNETQGGARPTAFGIAKEWQGSYVVSQLGDRVLRSFSTPSPKSEALHSLGVELRKSSQVVQ
jgi:hypothetical protein